LVERALGRNKHRRFVKTRDESRSCFARVQRSEFRNQLVKKSVIGHEVGIAGENHPVKLGRSPEGVYGCRHSFDRVGMAPVCRVWCHQRVFRCTRRNHITEIWQSAAILLKISVPCLCRQCYLANRQISGAVHARRGCSRKPHCGRGFNRTAEHASTPASMTDDTSPYHSLTRFGRITSAKGIVGNPRRQNWHSCHVSNQRKPEPPRSTLHGN